MLLVAALRRTDLSILGPINAYKAVVSLALGVVVLGEIPSAAGLAGVLLIVAGSAVVANGGSGFGGFFRDRGVQLRFAALACSATGGGVFEAGDLGGRRRRSCLRLVVCLGVAGGGGGIARVR